MKNNVSIKTTIKAPKETIILYIQNLEKWQMWSPFHAVDPDTENTYSEKKENIATRMDWNGKVNGIGFMQTEKVTENGINFHLEFIKPFKSKAKTNFILRELGENKIEVQWDMFGSLPFFLFFLKKLFNKMITNDFRRGLKRLKSVCETGKVPAILEYDDEAKEYSGFELYQEKATNVHITDLPKVMGGLMGDLEQEIKNKEGLEIIGGYCLYDKSQFLKDLFSFRCGYSVKGKGEKIISVPNHKAIKVTLKGKYEYLEDAWTGIMMHTRSYKFKKDKKNPPYEKYVIGPNDTKNPEEYVTEVIVPVK